MCILAILPPAPKGERQPIDGKVCVAVLPSGSQRAAMQKRAAEQKTKKYKKTQMEDDKDNMFLGASPLIFQRAEELRKKMTEAEKKLWEVLKNKKLGGFKFRRQHPILKFILDFYCHEAKLGIEIDGEVHNSKGQKFYDDDRTEILKEYGINIIRFYNDEIIDNLEEVKFKILSELQKET